MEEWTGNQGPYETESEVPLKFYNFSYNFPSFCLIENLGCPILVKMAKNKNKNCKEIGSFQFTLGTVYFSWAAINNGNCWRTTGEVKKTTVLLQGCFVLPTSLRRVKPGLGRTLPDGECQKTPFVQPKISPNRHVVYILQFSCLCSQPYPNTPTVQAYATIYI